MLNQPNLVGTVMIVLLFGAGLVYAFAFDGFNVETTTGGEVEAFLAQAEGALVGKQNVLPMMERSARNVKVKHSSVVGTIVQKATLAIKLV